MRNMNIASSTLNNMNTGDGWSNRFITRTSVQIQKGVDAFGNEYTAGQLGPRGAQPGCGKPMPAKNARFNELLFNFLDIINPANPENITIINLNGLYFFCGGIAISNI